MEEFFQIGTRHWDSEHEKLTGIQFDELGVNTIIDTLKNPETHFDAILEDFGNKNPNEDPVIHFYELFLKEYDALKRKSRGVYYTPRPVVSFIVRSVDEVLKTDFALELGLADTTTWGQMEKDNPDIEIPDRVSADDFFVQILDPALGTGTFLVEVIDTIAITMKTMWGKELGLSIPADSHDVVAWKHPKILERWNRYVPKCLLSRLYGFELMMAPYAIAHMKIGIKLFETGYQNFQQDNQRVRVYLTNTLEEPVNISEYLDTLDPAMAEETREANEIKKKNSITVVIGNPPYSGESANKTLWIRELVNSKYQYIEGRRIEEKGKKNWLLDDYVKFIRFSHYMAEYLPLAVIGLITNHAYLDNPTFRGLRHALTNDFTRLLLLDLHGNYKKREVCPDGGKDENVFDIQQGVCIGIFIRNQLLDSSTKPQHTVEISDLWGCRETKKYPTLSRSGCYSHSWSKLEPDKQFFFFKDVKASDEEYESWWPLTKIFPVNGNGIITAHDHFSIAFDDEELSERLDIYVNPELTDTEVLERLRLRENSMWTIRSARKSLRTSRNKNLFVDVLYRPFDIRRSFFHKSVIFNLRLPIMKHMVAGGNLAIISSRMTKGEEFAHLLASRTISEAILLSSKTSNNAFVFPLYEYADTGTFSNKERRLMNLSNPFVLRFATAFDMTIVKEGEGDRRSSLGPESILYYIYAILSATGYRKRYVEQLKRDFPRIPTTENKSLFTKLCHYGAKLVRLHLMDSEDIQESITTFPVSGSNSVDRIGEKGRTLASVQDGRGKLYINKTQYFDNLPEEVWNFYIGGYQVCYKWLYDRKKAGRRLSSEDIEHYHKIVVAINETIKIMNQIDETIESHGGWPIK